MIRQKSEFKPSTVSNLRGGKGDLKREDIFTPEEMLGKADWCIVLTIPVGCSIGEHPHGPDAEIYHLLSGTLRITDDGVTKDLKAGDVVFTGGGKIHSVENVSDADATMLAIKIP